MYFLNLNLRKYNWKKYYENVFKFGAIFGALLSSFFVCSRISYPFCDIKAMATNNSTKNLASVQLSQGRI